MRPAPRSPDGRTIRENSKSLAGYVGTKGIIPVTNPIERLNKEVKRRTPPRPADRVSFGDRIEALLAFDGRRRLPP